ncbi:hypothetical protein ACFL96_03880 [Thermoproteota archaeon]
MKLFFKRIALLTNQPRFSPPQNLSYEVLTKDEFYFAYRCGFITLDPEKNELVSKIDKMTLRKLMQFELDPGTHGKYEIVEPPWSLPVGPSSPKGPSFPKGLILPEETFFSGEYPKISINSGKKDNTSSTKPVKNFQFWNPAKTELLFKKPRSMFFPFSMFPKVSLTILSPLHHRAFSVH